MRVRASEPWIGLRDSSARHAASGLGMTGLAALKGCALGAGGQRLEVGR